MDTLSLGDNSTVVGGPASVAHGKDRQQDSDMYTKPTMTPNGYVPKRREVGTFVKAMDYTAEERPFFVNIDKKGLVAALQQLDDQLQKVSARSESKFGVPPDLASSLVDGQSCRKRSVSRCLMSVPISDLCLL